METEIDDLNQKIKILEIKLSEKLVTEKKSNNFIHLDELNSLKSSNEKMKEKLSFQEHKITDVYRHVNDSIQTLNTKINNTIVYSGVIGENCKFQNFHRFIDFTISNINYLNAFKEKATLCDTKNVKIYIDSNFQKYKSKVENIINLYNESVKGRLDALEKTITEKNENSDSDLSKEIKVINVKIKSIEEKIIDNFMASKDNNTILEGKIESVSLEFKKDISKVENSIDNLSKGLDEINLNLEKNFQKFDNKEKSPGKLPKYNPLFFKESGIKQYIRGDLDLEGLKRFNMKNPNFINYDESSSFRNELIKSDKLRLMNNLELCKTICISEKRIKRKNDDSKFMSKDLLDNYILETENVKLNSLPKKNIIKSLFIKKRELNEKKLDICAIKNLKLKKKNFRNLSSRNVIKKIAEKNISDYSYFDDKKTINSKEKIINPKLLYTKSIPSIIKK